jgi:hypothetical protein
MQEKAEVFALILAVPPSEADEQVCQGSKFTRTTWKGFDPDD